MLNFIAAILLGVAAGTFTGLIPGIHINLIASLLFGYLWIFAGIPSICLAVFIVSMSITHTFIDFIPSVFLGAPEEDSFLSVLPGHELALEGKGHEAVVLTLYGSISSLLIVAIFFPVFISFLPLFYNSIKFVIPFVLIFISFYLVLREDFVLESMVVFFLAGFLGIVTFSIPVKEPLMPLLTGLFGLSNLIVSMKQKVSIKKQVIYPLKNIKLQKAELLRAFSASFISAPLCSFLPGIGAGHAATIGSEIISQGRRGFLFLLGSINTIIMSLSFVTVYAIGKSRTGSAVAIEKILGEISLENLLTLAIAIIISGIVAFIVGILLSKLFATHITKISYQKLNFAVIVVLVLVNVAFTNALGIAVLITSASLGTYAILSGSRRINLMAALIVPAIIYYLA